MLTLDAFSIYIMFCVLAPLLGTFTLLFLFIFEKRIDLLEKQKREIALERELQTALYNQLNQEIQPHFFFNTLNSILSLARLNRKSELIRSIETLSKLLKFKYRTIEPFITIDEELTYVNYYLEIQKIRFRDRLFYEIELMQNVTEAVTIPFLIQTLVENAFKHAFEQVPGDARLRIEVKQQNQMILISVWNSCATQRSNANREHGLGLDNISKRLNLLFSPDKTAIDMIHFENGTTVSVIFPFIRKSQMKAGATV
ncbi:histidine kinase [Ectobacillus sp. JY-23]|uniref:sensor histidine kinase n=1 Tax=Ectobacillus sp. JY-23 TaxID=2933872 RepID=UPI001FF448B7|nr:histidine kinase [Ectobacillus sp. JY-23]UOY93315.1 histidine kinase [Ectobacillus sp. JY-23]